MGMSASQSRFLLLTAQKSNNEYQAQRITHERLVLAMNTENYTMEYNDKMNNKTLLFNPNTAADSDMYNYNTRLTFDDITRSEYDEANPGLGGRLTSQLGKVVVPELPLFDPETGLSPEGLTFNDYIVDEELSDPYHLQKAITDGVYFIELKQFKGDGDENGNMVATWNKVDYTDSATHILETYDITDDAAAQAEYDKLNESFQNKDKMLELRLKQLETEHTALQTEIDAVAKIVKENTESSFKTFG